LRKKLQNVIVNPQGKIIQVSKSRALAYKLNKGMTKLDYEETCRLVNNPGHYFILSGYNLLETEK